MWNGDDSTVEGIRRKTSEGGGRGFGESAVGSFRSLEKYHMQEGEFRSLEENHVQEEEFGEYNGTVGVLVAVAGVAVAGFKVEF